MLSGSVYGGIFLKILHFRYYCTVYPSFNLLISLLRRFFEKSLAIFRKSYILDIIVPVQLIDYALNSLLSKFSRRHSLRIFLMITFAALPAAPPAAPRHPAHIRTHQKTEDDSHCLPTATLGINFHDSPTPRHYCASRSVATLGINS